MRKQAISLVVAALCIGPLLAQEIKMDDGNDRAALNLTPPEKAYVLDQMRRFVESIQSITAGFANGDRDQAMEAAAARGLKRNQNDSAFPPTLGAKLPQEWRQFGAAMRKGFDSLADGIAKDEDTNQSLGRLSELMKNCVSCHASYRIVDAKL